MFHTHHVTTVVLLGLGIHVAVVADTIHVPGDQPTIQAGIDAAVNGDEVVVRRGTYRGAGNKDLDFHGKAIAVRCQDSGSGPCTIDCQGEGRGFYFHNAETHASIVDGFRIIEGSVAGSGGGVFCEDSSSPTIRNCTIQGNAATVYGGGVFCWESSANIINCNISGNTAGYFGGGVAFLFSDSSIDRCTIDANVAGGAFGRGGGVYMSHGSAAITDCTIRGNYASSCGGGIYSGGFKSQPMIVRCRIEGNVARTGGGLDVSSDSFPTITDSVISDNFARFRGGGISFTYSSGLVLNSTIIRNSASGSGGVVDCYFCDATLTNSILWDNVASRGPELRLRNSDDSAPSEVLVRYCVVSGGIKAVAVLDGSTLSWGSGNIDLDPLFPVGSNQFRLSAGSPCVNAGDPVFVPQAGKTDMDGHSRVLCGQVDMGAYEYGIGDHDCNDVVDLTDFGSWESCMTGPGGGPYPAGCEAFDFDGDGDVALIDFGGFQRELTTN